MSKSPTPPGFLDVFITNEMPHSCAMNRVTALKT